MAIQLRSDRDRSLGQVLSDIRTDASLLVRQEIALAKAELKQKAGDVAKRAALFAGVGLLAYSGLLILLAALVLGLIAIGVVAWLAALSVGIVVLLGAWLLVQRARGPKKDDA
ncbi:MAG TPA: phage holin family protein [Gemmatimonadales bacterium]|nr:phage holin family protein [Gemmatimonadales bacterium]